MHRTEGVGNLNNQFTDGPPGTVIGAIWLNSLQEEIAHVIEQAGLTLETANTDSKVQLYNALISAQNLINMGITATANEISTACAGIIATANEINTVVLTGKYGTRGMVLGDTTAGRVIRSACLQFNPGSIPNTNVDVRLENIWNSIDIDYENDLTKGGCTTSFCLAVGGNEVKIKATALGHTVLSVISCSVILMEDNVSVIAHPYVFLGEPYFLFYIDGTSSSYDVTDLSGAELFHVLFTYISSD